LISLVGLVLLGPPYGKLNPDQLSHDPAVGDIEANHCSDNDPPRFSDRRSILFRDIVLAIGTSLGILVDRPLAVRARYRIVIVAAIVRRDIVVFLVFVLPVVVAASSHFALILYAPSWGCKLPFALALDFENSSGRVDS
jgi:hypothetical protein